MTILGIDPGNSHSAAIVWDGKKVLFAEILENPDLLEMLEGGFKPVDRYVAEEPAVMAIEMVASYGMPVGREVFETVFWIGRFCQAWDETDPGYVRVERLKIKMHHCHDSRAKDSNIRQALIDKYGAPGTKANPGPTYGVKKDLWSALAVATWYAETHQTKR